MKKLLACMLLAASVSLADIIVTIPGSGGGGSSGSNVAFAVSAGTVQSSITGTALSQMNAAIAAVGTVVSNVLQTQISVNATNSADPSARATAALAFTGATNGQYVAGVALVDATNAQSLATAAQGTANTALIDATNAQSLATAAQGTANTALIDATNGQALATTAQGTANTAQSNSTNALAQAIAANANASSALTATHSGCTNSAVTFQASLVLPGVAGYATHNFFVSTATSDMTITFTNLSQGTLYTAFVPAGAVQRNVQLVFSPAGSLYFFGGANTSAFVIPASQKSAVTVQLLSDGSYAVSKSTGVPGT